MLIRLARGCAIAVSFTALCTLRPVAQENEWPGKTERDIRFIYDTLARQTPGTVDTENQWFKRAWEDGFTEALKKARQATTEAAYFAVMHYYINGFHEGHLSVNPVNAEDERAAWPGFMVSFKNGKYVVGQVDPSLAEGGPEAGVILSSCDGSTPDMMMRRDVLPYYGNPEWESHWTRQAPRLLVDDGNPWVKRPSQCTVTTGARDQVIRLNWRPIDMKTLSARIVDAGYGKPQPYRVRTFEPNGVWVSIPSWNPPSDEAKAALEAIIQGAPNWRERSILVFDTRGGGGGNASYSRRLLRGLYGDEYIRTLGAKHPFNVQWVADWRATKENATDVGLGLKAAAEEALHQNRALFREEFWIVPPSLETSRTVSNPVKAKVVLITDGRCFSNCWLFTRDVLAFPGTVQVGAATNAMTPYTQPRRVTLPSGLMTLGYPQKVFRSPLDHFRQPYVPTHRWDGDFTDTPAFERWILQMVR